ncbi:uncharacterized protein LOC118185298 [Stegodyphus dumicola]|uniref:uncharacterized protein LOC118185298 n=1 Tax=Stegodyphus dumicola TaxID=202533 RepID=UPI0015B0B074|nr:uncharacterized protein LOC118185298 [Stegodyphus dumicola]
MHRQDMRKKDFFKLMNNSVYGKTMENVRKHVDVQLVNTEKKAKKLVAAPTFHNFRIFDNDLVGVQRLKNCVSLNRPIYVGFVILELSKYHMYNFHYNHIKKQYGERAKLLFTDTDSLTYEILTEDVYRDMSFHTHLYDMSDYPKTHALYNINNKKKIGCFKDEMNSEPILEFIGLRAKMYSLLLDESEKKTAKGVKRSVIKRKLKHKNYRDCLEKSIFTRELQYNIQSKNHHLFTMAINKIALSAFDDKRYILKDGVHSLAYGHININNV